MPEPGRDVYEGWRFGLDLGCGHHYDLGVAPTFKAAQDALDALPKRKDDWYAAKVCWACRLRRRVVSAYVRMWPGGRDV